MDGRSSLKEMKLEAIKLKKWREVKAACLTALAVETWDELVTK